MRQARGRVGRGREQRKEGEFRMHQDGEGSSCRKGETGSPFSKKPILKTPNYKKKKKKGKEPNVVLQTLTKNKAHSTRTRARTRTRTHARQVPAPGRPRAGQLCPPPHLLDSSPRLRPEPAPPASPGRLEPRPAARTPLGGSKRPHVKPGPLSVRTLHLLSRALTFL